MKSLFPASFLLRPYIIIVVGIILVALLLDTILVSRGRQDAETELTVTWTPFFSLLQDTLRPLTEEQQTQQLRRYEQQWQIPVRLIELSSFAGDPQLYQELSEGKLQVYANSDNQPMLYQRHAGTAQIIALGPLSNTRQGAQFETLIISAYYTLIALVVFLWLRPFYRDLTLLRKAAANFGESDLSSRVQVPEKSSIYPVAQSFNAMADRIAYLISAHRELTHAVSHELRTPLARIRFSLEILARNDNPGKKQHYLDNMKGDISELEKLIDELLSYARLSDDNLLTSLVDINLRSWLREELAIYHDAPVKLSTSFNSAADNQDYRVSFNPDLMSRALHNIIRNDMRYARENIHLQINIEKEQVKIKICDDGPGIPEELISSIFEPFSRSNQENIQDSSGYGLGLAIASRILERHAGTIKVNNTEPYGACFTLIWPHLRSAST